MFLLFLLLDKSWSVPLVLNHQTFRHLQTINFDTFVCPIGIIGISRGRAPEVRSLILHQITSRLCGHYVAKLLGHQPFEVPNAIWGITAPPPSRYLRQLAKQPWAPLEAEWKILQTLWREGVLKILFPSPDDGILTWEMLCSCALGCPSRECASSAAQPW